MSYAVSTLSLGASEIGSAIWNTTIIRKMKLLAKRETVEHEKSSPTNFPYPLLVAKHVNTQTSPTSLQESHDMPLIAQHL